ncbi:MAG TPA: iron ABC transporter permease, partial [Hyphomicrobiaceae bacterium]|nr:iron ABC transporter permease [Hyphomicrobiaceae bacterium]
MTTVASTAPIARRRLGFDLSKPVLLAFAAILFALIAMPLSWLIFYAFTDKSGAFTLDNFHRLVSDAAYLDPLLTTFALATLSALICCVVAAPMGWLVARTDMPLRRTVRLLVTASFVTPPFLGAIAWELLAAPNSGLLNQLYRELTG